MKKYFLFSSLTTVVLYMITSFIKWSMLWISDLDTWDWFSRFMFVAAFAVKELFCIMIWDITNIKKHFEFKK